MKRKVIYILIAAMILPTFLSVLTPVSPGTPFVNIAQAQLSDGDTGFGDEGERVSSGPPDPKKADEGEFGLKCWVGLASGGVDPGGCFALIGYILFWIPAGLILMISAAVFDVAAAWSFNADILRSSMVSGAWGMVRDIANLGLIFALLYIAIATILQAGGVQLKKAVANVIIVALLINFSFFVTRVVIDVSNMFAQSLYSQIGTQVRASGTTSLGPTTIGSDGQSVIQISSRIVSAFNPQSFMTKEFVDAWRASRDGVSSLFFVFFFAAIVALVAAYAFLRAGILLIGRVVMFVFLIISSPLAFVAWALPSGGGGFDKKWWSALIDQALVAPVFFLFMYVITSVYRKDLLTGILGSSNSEDLIAFFVNIALHFLVVIIALLIAVSVTKKLSGAAGSYATKAIGGVVGGAVLGGTAYLARSTVGAAATRMAESDRFKRIAANNPTIGRWSKAGLDAAAGASFDVRSIPGLDDLGRARKGGYTADLKGRVKAKEELGKHLGNLKMGTREVTKFREEDELRPHPSGALDSSGNPIMEKIKVRKEYKESVPVTAKQVYTEKLGETSYAEGKDPKDMAWARSSRKAAVNLRKEKSKKEKFAEAAAEYAKEEGILAEEPKKESGDEKEKPKEV